MVEYTEENLNDLAGAIYQAMFFVESTKALDRLRDLDKFTGMSKEDALAFEQNRESANSTGLVTEMMRILEQYRPQIFVAGNLADAVYELHPQLAPKSPYQIADNAINRDLLDLLQKIPGKWVAYHKGQRVANVFDSKPDAIMGSYQCGIPEAEIYVRLVKPKVEMRV